MFGKHAVVLTLTVVAAAVTAVVAWAGPQFSGWATATLVDQADAGGAATAARPPSPSVSASSGSANYRHDGFSRRRIMG